MTAKDHIRMVAAFFISKLKQCLAFWFDCAEKALL